MAQARRWRRLLISVVFSLLSAAAQAGQLPSAPTWDELTPGQRDTLAPLSKDWNGMGYVRRKKWIGIADRFTTMTPEEQQRVITRMREWANLSPEARTKARSQYKRLQKLPADQRPELKRSWEQYQALTAEARSRLRPPAAIARGRERDRYQPIPPEWLVPPYLRPLRSFRATETPLTNR